MAFPQTPGGRIKSTSDEQIRKIEREDKWDNHSVTKSYYRSRAEEMPEYIQKLSIHDKEKLQADAERVRTTRDRLLRTKITRDLLFDLGNSFDEWRSDAEGRKVMFRYRSDERGHHVKNFELCPGDIELCEPIGSHGAHEGIKDPALDYKAGVLFFERYGIGWKKATYHGYGFDKNEKFPNQKLTVYDALFDEDQNPFGNTIDEEGRQHLKYIHLPANHMGWVEVNLPRGGGIVSS